MFLSSQYLNKIFKVFDKPFKVDEKVGGLLDAMESTLQRVVLVDIHAPHDAVPDYTNTKHILRQVNECLNFLNTYTRQTYCASRIEKAIVIIISPLVFLGSITLKAIGRDYVSVIDNYISNLVKMSGEFDTTRRIVTETLVYRTMESIEKLGARLSLHPGSHLLMTAA